MGCINDALNSAPAPHPEVRLYQHTKGSVRVTDAIDIIRATQNGATLIFENVDRYNVTLGCFLNALSAELGESTRCNLYASSPERQGFPLHFDTHDFFILQIAGHKRWKVFPSTVEDPLFFRKDHRAPPPRESSIYFDSVLAPGDTLYVPKGHWHEAIAHKEPSLHLTLAIFVQTGVDFLLWLTDELRENQVFRRRFPLLFQEERNGDRGMTALSASLRDLEQALVAMFSNKSSLASNYLAFLAAKQKMRNTFSYPDPMLENPIEQRDYTRFIFPKRPTHIRRKSDGTIDVITSGRTLTLSHSALPVITIILSHEPFSVADLRKQLPTARVEQVCGLLNKLLQDGLIVPI